MRLHLARLLVAVFVMLVAPPSAFTQGAAGTISGTIKDETGGVLPGASIVVTNTDTGFTRELYSDAAGRYRASDLVPGPYEVRASLAGFGTVVRSGIRLTVGRDAVVDIGLAVGQLENAILVVGEAPTVDTKSASTGGLISGEQIENMPLNGRSYVELATMTPGVLMTQTGGQSTSTGFGMKLSVNGSRYTANLFTLDGTNLNDQYGQAGSASGNVLGVEAVREFQVLTNSFTAEFGHHTGGIVNAATKSGTNEFHGSAFEFHRNDGLDAKNYFDIEKPPFERNQFGYSLGGPIARNKTFFFTTYEGLREGLGRTNIFTVPSAAVRAGAVTPAVRPWLESYPLPNGTALDANRGEFVRVDTRTTKEHYVLGRLDHQFSPGSQVFARYALNDAEVNDPNNVIAGAITKTRTQFLTAEHTAVMGGSFLNRLQFGFTRSRLDGFDYLLDGFTLPLRTFTDFDIGLPVVSVTGVNGLGGDTTNPKFHRFNNFQIREHATYTSGGHTLKVGGDIQFLEFNLTSAFTTMGQYTFRSVADFVNMRVNQFNAQMPGSDPSRSLHQTAYGLYVQDDWQVASTFTLNLGVRYEPTSSVTDSEDRLAQLIDFASPTASLNDTTPVPDGLFKNPSLKSVAPRVGFAWDVRGNGKTAIRGGAGVFYDTILISTPFVQNTAVRVPPYFNRGGLVGSGNFVVDFPNAYTTQAARLAAQVQLEGIQYDLDQPYVVKWNLNVQRELPGRTTLELGYTGSHAEHLVRQIFTNGREAHVTADGRLFVAPNTPLRQPNFGRMRYRVSDSTSDYYGLTAGLSRRFASGFQAQVSYTYSKSIDDGAAALGGNDFNSEGGGSRYLFTKDRGLSPFDLRHAISASASYVLPFARNATGVRALVAKDWRLGVLFRARSGYPFSALSGVDTGLQVQGWAPSFTDLRPGATPNPVIGRVEQWFDPTAFLLPPSGFIGTVPRNTIIGPDSRTLDMNVSKDLPLGGRREVSIRIEVFNLLNRANFGLPQNQIFNTDGSYRTDAGRITSTSGSARQAQLGVRFAF